MNMYDETKSRVEFAAAYVLFSGIRFWYLAFGSGFLISVLLHDFPVSFRKIFEAFFLIA